MYSSLLTRYLNCCFRVIICSCCIGTVIVSITSTSTLEYRISGGGGVRIIGGLEMARYKHNLGVGIIGGGCLEK